MVGMYSPTLSPWLAWTSYSLGEHRPHAASTRSVATCRLRKRAHSPLTPSTKGPGEDRVRKYSPRLCFPWPPAFQPSLFNSTPRSVLGILARGADSAAMPGESKCHSPNVKYHSGFDPVRSKLLRLGCNRWKSNNTPSVAAARSRGRGGTREMTRVASALPDSE